MLPKGKYEFQASIKTNGVVVLADGNQKSAGAGIRVSGGPRPSSQAGTADWTLQKHVFEVVQDGQHVILVAELRATAGTAQFDSSTMKLVRLKP